MTETLASAVVVRALGFALLQSLWQGVVIGLAAAAVLAALRRAAPNVRYLVACGALLSMVLVVALTTAGAARDLRVETGRGPTAVVAASRAPAPAAAAPGGIGTPAALTGEAPATEASGAIDWAAPAVLVWGLGVLLLSIRLAVAWTRVGRLGRGGRAVPYAVATSLDRVARRVGVTRVVALVESATVSVPTLVGWLRPVILLPAGALVVHHVHHSAPGESSTSRHRQTVRPSPLAGGKLLRAATRRPAALAQPDICASESPSRRCA